MTAVIAYDVVASERNEASGALVRSLGSEQVGEHIDDVDGLELVFERPLPLKENPSGGDRSVRRTDVRRDRDRRHG